METKLKKKKPSEFKVNFKLTYEQNYNLFRESLLGSKDAFMDKIVFRKYFTQHFGFAIVTEEVVSKLKEYSEGTKKIIDYGCGTGYCTKLFRDRGLECEGYDIETNVDQNKYGFSQQWIEIKEASPQVLQDKNSILFLSWPNYDSDFGVKTISEFTGDIIFLVHEGRWGCIGNNEMYDELDENWSQIETIDIPQWSGVADYVSIFNRN